MPVPCRFVLPVVASLALIAAPGGANAPAFAQPGPAAGAWPALGGELVPAPGLQVGALSLAAGRGGPVLSLSAWDPVGLADSTNVWQWTGSAWSAVGAPQPAGGASVTVGERGQLWECSGAEGYGARRGPLVRRWVDGQWSQLGGDVAVETGDAEGGRRYLVEGCSGVLLDPTGTPVVTWIANVGAKAHFIYAARWDAGLGRWVGLDGPGNAEDRSTWAYADMDDAGALYVAAYKPGGGYGGQPTSRVYRWDGSAWSMLGAGWEQTARPVVLAGEDEDEVYVAYADPASGLIRVARWVEADAAWLPLPSPGAGEAVALEMTRSGHLVAAVSPAPGQAADGIRVSVLGGGRWHPVGGPASGPLTGGLDYLSLTLDRADRPTVAWVEYLGEPGHSAHAAGYGRPARP